MPTYAYECDACGHSWELFQKITDDAVKSCPDCKKKKARRLFGTGAAVVFKGSGFYQTDYRSDSYKKGEKAAKDSKKDSKSDSGGSDSKSGSTKAESKPAKKSGESKGTGGAKSKD